jgi:ABC-type sugar transport system permease subunit
MGDGMDSSIQLSRRRAFSWKAVVVPYLYLAPFLILFLLFRVYPLLYGLYLSLTNAELGRLQTSFVGLLNYQGLLSNPRFQTSVVNTIVFTLEATIPVLGIPLLLAVILNRAVNLRTLLRSVFFFPFTLSVVTVGLIWAWLLDPLSGPVTYYLNQIGIYPPPWLGDARTAMPSIVLATVWSVTGYYMVIYLAALQDVPQHLLEAAALDGADGWRQFWSVTFPLLRPVMLFVVIIHIIGALQVFGIVFVMTKGGPADATLTIVQYIYLIGFQGSFRLGPAAAMSWVLFVAIFVVSLIQFRVFSGRAEY